MPAYDVSASFAWPHPSGVTLALPAPAPGVNYTAPQEHENASLSEAASRELAGFATPASQVGTNKLCLRRHPMQLNPCFLR
jgi:hypothetical protein